MQKSAHVRSVVLRVLWSPWLVATFVIFLYGTWLVTNVDRSHPARVALIGHQFLDAGRGQSDAIDDLRAEVIGPVGYDGQFLLYIALAPVDAQEYIDNPAYRYTRILYPLIARAIALGIPGAIPWSLLAVNILAAALLTLSTSWYLRRSGLTPWYALIVGLAPGLYASVSRDLTEPLAYALIATGLLVLSSRASYATALAGVLMGLGALARESAVMFALAAAICLAIGRDEAGRRTRPAPRRAMAFAALAIAPIVVLKAALSLAVSGNSAPGSALFETTPLGGIISRPEFGIHEKQQVVAVVIPALIAVVTITLLSRRVSIPLLALHLNVLFFVILLPAASYEHVLTSSRITLGVPLAFVLCLPLVAFVPRILLATIPTTFWMLGWLSMSLEV
jgi:hypothetical protein